ncbi:MAG: hypothetical protein GKC10_03390 [Methanosarcinales archaeon]|nr:hypothetical protein [Methanosarcinales archaeon]
MKHLILLMALALFGVACLASISSAQSLVDQYIDYSRGDVPVMSDPRFAPDPRSSRELWGKNNEEPASIEGQAAAASEENRTDEQPMPVEAPLPAAPAAPADMAGNWSLELQDSASQRADLVLFQSGATVFGHGTLTQGNDSRLVGAVGDVQGEVLNLDLITHDQGDLFSLILSAGGRSTSGSFEAYRVLGGSWSGSVIGNPAA